EVVQCHYRSENSSNAGVNKPLTTSRPNDYQLTVRVKVCVPGVDAASSRCKPYANAITGEITYKPFGLLQRYGDNSTINFGLISGSYTNNISGGVLRKNIVPLTGNSNALHNEID